MKNKSNPWIFGIGCGEHEYQINNVTYVVSSRFEPRSSKQTVKDRFQKVIVSDFIPLTVEPTENIIADEYVCSGCEKED